MSSMPALLERTDLPLEQRHAAELDQTLRLVARRAVEPGAFAGRENDAHLDPLMPPAPAVAPRP